MAASPVMVSEHVAASPKRVWALLTSPGHLAECHPFVSDNPVRSWPGVGSEDGIVYHSGRQVSRVFTSWHEGTGYDLTVSDANGPLADVSWRIVPRPPGTELSISLVPRMLDGVPRLVRPVWAIVVRRMLRRYLWSVVRGVEHRVTTGQPVMPNQFGSHPWFS